MNAISSTEFARNPRGVYDEVLRTREAVEITHHGRPTVRIEPVHSSSGASGRALAEKIRARKAHLHKATDPTWQGDYDTAINPIESLEP